MKFPRAYSGVAIFLADISHDFWSIGDFTSRFKSNCLKCMKACCKENWDYSLTVTFHAKTYYNDFPLNG